MTTKDTITRIKGPRHFNTQLRSNLETWVKENGGGIGGAKKEKKKEDRI